MKLSYTTALLRYCNDLTDPDAPNVPVGAFLVARTDDSYYAAAAGFEARFVNTLLGEPNVLSESMLDDLPQLIKRHINEVFSDQKDAPDLGTVLFDLESALRNTLNVSDISDVGEMEKKESSMDTLGSELSDLVTHRLLDSLKEFGFEVVVEDHQTALGAIKERLGRSKHINKKSTRKYELPAQTFWPVHSQPTERAVG